MTGLTGCAWLTAPAAPDSRRRVLTDRSAAVQASGAPSCRAESPPPSRTPCPAPADRAPLTHTHTLPRPLQIENPRLHTHTLPRPLQTEPPSHTHTLPGPCRQRIPGPTHTPYPPPADTRRYSVVSARLGTRVKRHFVVECLACSLLERVSSLSFSGVRLLRCCDVAAV